jgi:membrane protease YdiL (CAAX protease family)
MINTPETQLKKPYNRMSPGLQLMTFVGVFLAILILGNIIAVALATALFGLNTVMAITQANFTAPHVVNALWIIQIIGTTIPIFTAPVLFAYVVIRDPQDYLKPTTNFSLVLALLVFCVMFISSPLIEFLSNINQKLILPHFLSGLQQWMRDSEDAAQKLTALLLHMNTVWNMIVDLLVIGLLTAIAEEFMFRGVIQTIFTRWTKNYHVAIWVTAILFSAFHMEFFGFLPRMMLGVLFGYFVAWSGSIWTSVWAHFINNGTAVVVTYLFQHKKIGINPDDQHVFNSAGYIISLVIVLFLLYVYRNATLTKPQLQDH